MTERPRMTDAEVAVMRAIVRWRREMGIEYDHDGAAYVDPHGPRVTWDYSNGPEIGYTRSPRKSFQWIAVSTVAEAVDILVALGFLPARFSSAYREGLRDGYDRGYADGEGGESSSGGWGDEA
jgi:hypothetical protein